MNERARPAQCSQVIVDDVTLTADGRRPVRDIAMTARPGEVIGPNGSGKRACCVPSAASCAPRTVGCV
ncbi:hypothetical protein [Streptomyces sp. NBC_00316]|uniref:hypothetical protein n=1 Tax=Streptomyces sp. NBC_00316 TaxID=2975710 RepID=UPI002E2B352A|nr:hypothetical protein [Streptomyces sp. NBC_00316]